MIGNFFLLIDKVEGRDTIVGEGIISEVVAPGHYRCEFQGPGPAYARILAVPDMKRLLLFSATADLKRFKERCFNENVQNPGA